MKILKTTFKDLLILTPTVFEDSRGSFYEGYHQQKLFDLGINTQFIQDNFSRSQYGTIRGLHYQERPATQTKLIQVISGTILDIALDLRQDSSTYGSFFSHKLTDTLPQLLLIPAGFAHGYSVLSREAIVSYKCDHHYSPKNEKGINCYDPLLNIDWEVPPDQQIIGQKDRKNPNFQTGTYL